MRVLMLVQRPQARGAELFTVHLAETLIQRGHEVSLISLFGGDFELPFFGRIYHLKRNPSHRFFDFGAWKSIDKIIRNFNPEIIQAMGADTLKFMVFSNLVFRWKGKMIFCNGSMISQYIQSRSIKLFNQLLYNRIDGIVAISQTSKLDFKKIFSFHYLHEVVSVGIKISEKINLKAPLPNPVLVHIGGFTFEKNHPDLLGIFSTVLSENPDFKLLMIGEGPMKNQIEKLVAQKNLSPQIKFLGTHREPFSLVPKNAILVLPSKIEGMPAVIGEAFVHRIPVIAYDVGAVSELVKTNKTGWLIPPGEPKKMVEAILNVSMLDSNQLSRILDAAEQFAKENLDILQVAIQYESFYKKIVTGEKPKFRSN